MDMIFHEPHVPQQKDTPRQRHNIITTSNPIMNYFEDAEEEGIECFHIGDVLTRSSDEADDSNYAANYSEEGIECFHIGDIIARTSEADDSTDSEASSIAASHHNHNKKRLIGIGAAVIAVSVAIATGVLISSGQSSTQKRVAASSVNAEEEIPWFACLDKQSCFRQAICSVLQTKIAVLVITPMQVFMVVSLRIC